MNEKEEKILRDFIMQVFKKEEEYLQRRIRTIWKTNLGQKILRKFVYVVVSRDYKVIEDEKGNAYLQWTFDIACKPKILKYIFLRRDTDEN